MPYLFAFLQIEETVLRRTGIKECDCSKKYIFLAGIKRNFFPQNKKMKHEREREREREGEREGDKEKRKKMERSCCLTVVQYKINAKLQLSKTSL